MWRRGGDSLCEITHLDIRDRNFKEHVYIFILKTDILNLMKNTLFKTQ